MSGNACVLVIGPAGVGKSTLCANLIEYGMTVKRKLHLVNLDPAAEHFPIVQPTKDIRECLPLETVMEETELGPNGGLVFCMETLLDNLESWLDLDEKQLFQEDFLIVDCPGQIELFTHYTFINDIIQTFQRLDYAVCVLYCLESSFILNPFKFMSGTLNALSAMARIQAPHINIITKMDLLDKQELEDGIYDKYLEVDTVAIAEQLEHEKGSDKFQALSSALLRLIEEHNMVRFVPLDIQDEESLQSLFISIDHVLQYDESQEPREPRDPQGRDGEDADEDY